jgi:hypothetical protein
MKEMRTIFLSISHNHLKITSGSAKIGAGKTYLERSHALQVNCQYQIHLHILNPPLTTNIIHTFTLVSSGCPLRIQITTSIVLIWEWKLCMKEMRTFFL